MLGTERGEEASLYTRMVTTRNSRNLETLVGRPTSACRFSWPNSPSRNSPKEYGQTSTCEHVAIFSSRENSSQNHRPFDFILQSETVRYLTATEQTGVGGRTHHDACSYKGKKGVRRVVSAMLNGTQYR